MGHDSHVGIHLEVGFAALILSPTLRCNIIVVGGVALFGIVQGSLVFPRKAFNWQLKLEGRLCFTYIHTHTHGPMKRRHTQTIYLEAVR